MGPILKDRNLNVLIEFRVKPEAVQNEEVSLLDGTDQRQHVVLHSSDSATAGKYFPDL